MPAVPCGNLTLTLDQSDNDCPTTDIELVERILQQAKVNEKNYKDIGILWVPPTTEEVYKALHFLDPETFPSETAAPGAAPSLSGFEEADDLVDGAILNPAKGETSTLVEKPGPTQDQAWEDCTKWYLVETGDSCHAISENNAIGLDMFYAWNPAVSKDGECTQLWVGYAVCVGAAVS